MEAQITQPPRWEIDEALETLLNTDVRVAARRFSPNLFPSPDSPKLRPVGELVLPDNTRPSGLIVLFEGNLKWFHREVGVILVGLDALTCDHSAGDGLIPFRGSWAAIVKAPAVVELASPITVEKLPFGEENYWRDLRMPRAQFEFLFNK